MGCPGGVGEQIELAAAAFGFDPFGIGGGEGEHAGDVGHWPAEFPEVFGLDVDGAGGVVGERRAEVGVGSVDGDAEAVLWFLPAVGSDVFVLIFKLDGEAAPLEAKMSDAADSRVWACHVRA